MSYRYSTLDIIVGIGLCAIVFGAVLFVVAANGSFQPALPHPFAMEQPVDSELGMIWLQPALGQAIVDEALLERRTHQAVAHSAAEWNRATLAHQAFQSIPGGPFGSVLRQAEAVPADHAARVQGVMGRAVVNFTQRGIHSGVFSADQHLSDFNTNMIRATEVRGERLHDAFASTWQATLGQRIVEAIQSHRKQASAMQEQLGAALVHVAQAQNGSDTVQAAQQEQLASLVMAAVRTEALSDRLTLLAAIESFPEDSAVASTEPAAWPGIPMGVVIAASLALGAIFFGGLSLNARSRETKALAEMQRQTARWGYRLAA